jgi:hypothetical protein
MKRGDLLQWEVVEIEDDRMYIAHEDVMDFIDKIESRVNDFVKDLDSVDSIADLYKIESIRDDIKSLGDELY